MVSTVKLFTDPVTLERHYDVTFSLHINAVNFTRSVKIASQNKHTNNINNNTSY